VGWHPDDALLAALISIPESGRGGAGGWRDGLGRVVAHQVRLILPTVGIGRCSNFCGNFNAFDLIYATQKGQRRAELATDIMGTFFYRTSTGCSFNSAPDDGATVAA